jgi:hypothetical protein
MAEINKLSVGQALDKLRGTDAPSSKMQRLDEKIGALDEEIQRLRAANRRLERDQRAGSTVRDASQARSTQATKPKTLWIIIITGIVILIPIVALGWLL